MRHAAMTRVAILSVLVMSCSGTPADQPNRSRAPQTELPTNRAHFALSFEPGTEGVDLVIRRAQRAVRGAPAKVDGYVRLARAFLRKRRETADAVYLAYAKDAIAAADQISPRDPDVIGLSIMASFDGHEFRAASERAVELIAAEPQDPTGYLLLGDALLELGDYTPAVDAYQHAMDLYPDLRSYSRAAYIRWLNGDYDGSMELWEDALQSASARDPEPAAWCYVELGKILLSRGNASGALAAADSADGLVSDYLPALVLRGRAMARLDRTGESIAALQAAVDRYPTVATLLLLSDQLEAAGKMAEARANVARAEGKASHDPLPMALWYARRAESRDRAVELARKAVEKRPSVWAHDALALALLRAGDVAGADKEIAVAMSLGTPVAELHLHRGLIAQAAGDAKTARAELEAARGLDAGADTILLSELTRKLGAETTVAIQVKR